jgi:hypothetical protein
LEHVESGGRILHFSTIAESRVVGNKFRFAAKHLRFGKLQPNLAKKVVRELTFRRVAADDQREYSRFAAPFGAETARIAAAKSVDAELFAVLPMRDFTGRI